MYVGREPRVHRVPSRLEIENREGASADRAEKRAGVLTLGKENPSSRLTPQYLSKASSPVAIIAPKPVVIECANFVAPSDLSEPRGSGRHFRRIHERHVNI